MHFISLQTYRNTDTHYNIKLIIQFIIFEDQEMFARFRSIVYTTTYNIAIHKMIVLQQICVRCKNIWNLYSSVYFICVVIEYVYFCDKKRVSSLIHCMVSYDYYTAYILLSVVIIIIVIIIRASHPAKPNRISQHILYILYCIKWYHLTNITIENGSIQY